MNIEFEKYKAAQKHNKKEIECVNYYDNNFNSQCILLDFNCGNGEANFNDFHSRTNFGFLIGSEICNEYWEQKFKETRNK